MKGGKEIRNRSINTVTGKACGSSLLRYRAGITIEAALCVPLMISALVMLVMPLKIFDERRKLQTMLEEEAKRISAAAYAAGIAEDLINNELEEEEKYTEHKELLKLAAAEAAVLSKIDRNTFDNISFGSKSSVLSGNNDDAAMIKLYVNYDIKPPVNLLNIDRINMSSVVSRRAFVGSKGGRGRERYSDDESGAYDEADKIVYVGRNRSRYHLKRDCHYISNDIRSADAAEISKLSNADGRHYKPCTVCKPESKGTVYYFESGSKYHGNRSCSSLAAYVEAVRLSEVRHLGACSYCGRHI